MSPLSTAGATADADASSVARPYDFRRPTKLSREHVRVLEMASETLGRQWTTLLTTTLRAVSTATVTSVDQASYDEFISTLDTETALFVLARDPIPGIGMMEISQHTAMSMVDHLLGGPGSPNQPQAPHQVMNTRRSDVQYSVVIPPPSSTAEADSHRSSTRSTTTRPWAHRTGSSNGPGR